MEPTKIVAAPRVFKKEVNNDLRFQRCDAVKKEARIVWILNGFLVCEDYRQKKQLYLG